MMRHCFSALGTRHSDRMMLLLVLFGGKYGIRDEMFHTLTDSQGAFRKECVDSFKNYNDIWGDSQKAWKKWEDTNRQLEDTNKRLEAVSEESKKFWQESQKAWKKMGRIQRMPDRDG